MTVVKQKKLRNNVILQQYNRERFLVLKVQENSVRFRNF